jgi:catechol 2,3-dioxygenase-like lactoylglutathione lyase family enzyme
MATAPIAVTGFSHVAISVTDLAAARAFYCGILGFEELPRPDFGFPGMWLGVGELQLHFVETEEMPTPGKGFPPHDEGRCQEGVQLDVAPGRSFAPTRRRGHGGAPGARRSARGRTTVMPARTGASC